MSTTSQSKSSPVIPDGLLTAQAVNLRFAAIREKFRTEVKCDRPVPFIVWRQGLTEEQEARLQYALSSRARKEDVALIPAAEETLKWMIRNRRA